MAVGHSPRKTLRVTPGSIDVADLKNLFRWEDLHAWDSRRGREEVRYDDS